MGSFCGESWRGPFALEKSSPSGACAGGSDWKGCLKIGRGLVKASRRLTGGGPRGSVDDPAKADERRVERSNPCTLSRFWRPATSRYARLTACCDARITDRVQYSTHGTCYLTLLFHNNHPVSIYVWLATAESPTTRTMGAGAGAGAGLQAGP